MVIDIWYVQKGKENTREEPKRFDFDLRVPKIRYECTAQRTTHIFSDACSGRNMIDELYQNSMTLFSVQMHQPLNRTRL